MFKHGADLEKIRRKYDIKGEVLDFSCNVNPFTPENIVGNIIENIETLKKYPDIEYVELRKVIAQNTMDSMSIRNDIDEKNICVGNGSTELIYLITKVIDEKIGVVNPTFSEYERAIKIMKKEYIPIMMENIDDKFEYPNLEEIDGCKDLSALIICNPNNPDGRLRNIDKIVEFCEKYDIKLIVDETFIEFSSEFTEYTAMKYSYKNIYVIRAATKMYGIPGIRLGYMFSRDVDLLDEMMSIKLPWTVNTLAESLGMKIFNDKKFKENTIKFYNEEREFLIEELKNIDKLSVYDSNAAFILVRINEKSKMTASELKNRLIVEHKILIRDASNFRGLDDRYFRIAIKRRSDNMVLIESLKECFKEGYEI